MVYATPGTPGALINPKARYENFIGGGWVAPVRGEYFTSSGKMLRSAEFSDVKDFGNGHQRPSHVVMRNEIATQRFSEMHWDAVDTAAPVGDGKFSLSDLGH